MSKKYILIMFLTLVVGFVLSLIIGFGLRKNIVEYNTAKSLLEEKDYKSAAEKFKKLRTFKNAYKLEMFAEAQELLENEEYESAVEKLEEVINLCDDEDEMKLDCENEAIKLRYNMAEKTYNDGEVGEAIKKFERIIELYGDNNNELITKSEDRIKEIKYSLAEERFFDNQYNEAEILFKELGTYRDSAAYVPALQQ